METQGKAFTAQTAQGIFWSKAQGTLFTSFEAGSWAAAGQGFFTGANARGLMKATY